MKTNPIALATDDHTVSVLTHLAAAAFGMWAGLVQMGQEMQVRGLCRGSPGAREACRQLAATQHTWQIQLTVAGLALIVAAAGIELYKQERGRDDAG